MSSDDEREFDLVLWGASGFTGCLVAHYLASHDECAELDWAIAGRNEEKLRDVRSGLGDDFEDLPILLGDSFDRPSLDDIAAQTRVVCTTVGPYSEFGKELVAACVEHGTDYCDLTGESHFVRQMIDAHHDTATEKGVRIVHCCGFDSIPSDLGTLMVQKEALHRHGTPCDEVRFLIWKIRGGLSGGTITTIAQIMEEASGNREMRRNLGHPYALNPEGEQSGPDGSFQRGPRREKELDAWSAPFMMAAINEKIVRRTNALLDYDYGKTFRYSEATHLGSGLPGAVRATTMSAGLGAFAAALSLSPTRKLLQRFLLPSPGEGPSEETIEEGKFSIRLFGRGADENGHPFELVATVSADRDPGYGATAKMIGESALCLAMDDVEDGLKGGVLTPASAMGSTLIDRLRRAGMTFDVQ